MANIPSYMNDDKKLPAEFFNSSKPILIEVRAEWSGGSHLMDPIVNEIKEEFKKEINVERIDFESYKKSLSPFGVESVPAFLLISKGEIIEVIKETISKTRLEKIVQDLIIKNSSKNEQKT
jgi:thioredoxin-like negative regulator of GroEL